MGQKGFHFPRHGEKEEKGKKGPCPVVGSGLETTPSGPQQAVCSILPSAGVHHSGKMTGNMCLTKQGLAAFFPGEKWLRWQPRKGGQEQGCPQPPLSEGQAAKRPCTVFCHCTGTSLSQLVPKTWLTKALVHEGLRHEFIFLLGALDSIPCTKTKVYTTLSIMFEVLFVITQG